MNENKKSNGIRPKQSLGQNFLCDNNIIGRIVDTFEDSRSDLSPASRVVEVGPGLGALTSYLLPVFPNLHAIEIDLRAIEQLQYNHRTLSVEHGDVLRTDWKALSTRLSAPLAVVGNIPYNIVSQILMSLLEAPPGSVDFALVMMQREVAQRITSPTRCKSYGVLSVLTQLYSKPKVMFSVPPTAFYPKPSVTSAIVRFEFIPHKDFDTKNAVLTDGLKRVLKAAFNQRRKVLRNSLKRMCELQNVELPDKWEAKRAEELTPIEFVELTKFMYDIQPNKATQVNGEDNPGDKHKSMWR